VPQKQFAGLSPTLCTIKDVIIHFSQAFSTACHTSTMELDEKYLARVIDILKRTVAYECARNYALRMQLLGAADFDASIDIQNKAWELAKDRHARLL
jgi:hypothetical protein